MNEVTYKLSLNLTHREIEILRNLTSALGFKDTEYNKLQLKIANSLLDSGYRSAKHRGE